MTTLAPPEIERLCREAWTAEGLGEKTIQSYLVVYRRAEVLAAELGTTVLELTAAETRQLAENWPHTRSSRSQLRSALNHVWEACADRPFPGARAVPVPSKPHYHCRALSEASAGALAAVAHSDRTPAGLAVQIGLYSGLRRAEIARLQWAQVDFVDGMLRVVGKGDISAEIPLHHELVNALGCHLLLVDKPGRYVFPGAGGHGHVSPATVWNWTRRLGRVALGRPVATHVLRHTAIATLNDATGDLRAAQIFARHARPEDTALYTRVQLDRLRNAVESINYGREPHV